MNDADEAAKALTYLLDTVDTALAELDTGTLLLSEVDDFDTALTLTHAAQLLAAKAKAIAGGFHDRAWVLRGDEYGDYHHPDLGVVSVRRTARRPRWDHEGTVERVIGIHMAENGGEVVDPSEVARWLLDAASLSYWRKGKLKALGIDPEGEDLFWSERGHPAIGFTSAPDV